jgi:hypothetical protein
VKAKKKLSACFTGLKMVYNFAGISDEKNPIFAALNLNHTELWP